MSKLKLKVKQLPTKPGVYKFLGPRGEVLYVGKAKNLRSRVGQYFNNSDTRAQLPFLIAEAVDLDVIVVNSELESLFLENTLIKEYLPNYNIKLRDDKNYAFIKIDYSSQIPQINYARKVDETKSLGTNQSSQHFGPYSSTKKIRQTLDFLRRVFPYCANKQIGKRPCFYYHLHRCPGVCIGAVSLEDYALVLKKISLFLSGNTVLVKKQLQNEMTFAAKKKQFESAAKLRDQLQAITVLEEKQLTLYPQLVNWDFLSVYSTGLNACVNLFKVRGGKLIDKENFIYDNVAGFAEITRDSQVLQTFSEQYYSEASDLPKKVFTQVELSNHALVMKLLSMRAKRVVEVQTPRQGDKLKTIKLGKANAEQYLQKWQSSQADNLDAINETLNELQALLNLPTLPKRIEGYDISNTQGTNPVGSMVVAKNGQAAKSEYRKFKIVGKNTPDDFGMMREMLERRLKRSINGKEEERWPLPDLIVIDGGKGQLGVAVEVLQNMNQAIPVVGLAKRIEEIFLPHNSKPIVLPHDNPILQMLQRLRDEAHRFGITFHKSLRSKQAVKSALDTIPGIGPKTKKLLKQKIGTVEQIRHAPIETLVELIGSAKTELIKKHLR